MMELSGILLKALGKLAVFGIIINGLGWIDHMLQKYLMEIEPVSSIVFANMIMIAGVILWTVGDLLDRREG